MACVMASMTKKTIKPSKIKCSGGGQPKKINANQIAGKNVSHKILLAKDCQDGLSCMVTPPVAKKKTPKHWRQFNINGIDVNRLITGRYDAVRIKIIHFRQDLNAVN